MHQDAASRRDPSQINKIGQALSHEKMRSLREGFTTQECAAMLYLWVNRSLPIGRNVLAMGLSESITGSQRETDMIIDSLLSKNAIVDDLYMRMPRGMGGRTRSMAVAAHLEVDVESLRRLAYDGEVIGAMTSNRENRGHADLLRVKGQPSNPAAAKHDIDVSIARMSKAIPLDDEVRDEASRILWQYGGRLPTGSTKTLAAAFAYSAAKRLGIGDISLDNLSRWAKARKMKPHAHPESKAMTPEETLRDMVERGRRNAVQAYNKIARRLGLEEEQEAGSLAEHKA